jgi:hypothetical protein
LDFFGRRFALVPLRQYALRKKLENSETEIVSVAFSRQIRHCNVHWLQIKDKNATRAREGNGQWPREECALVLSAGLKLYAQSLPRLNRACGFSLLFLQLGGCMTLGGTTPPPADSPAVADAQPLLHPSDVSRPEPTVIDNISTYVGPRSARMAPHEKKRERRPQQLASAAHESPARGSTIDPGSLIGMAPAGVRELLGPPGRIESYDLSREWIYASNGCSFRLFFYPNLNTAAFRVLKYGGNDGNGELMDVSDVCIRHILTARKNATG